ncbi:hypothetical protein SAURM35S_03638 [Streptomyces aurantiogriseus]
MMAAGLAAALLFASGMTAWYDFLGTYVADLPNVLDLDAVRAAGVRIGADPLGGASVAYWGRIAEEHRLDLTVVNPLTDPTWRFMTLDWDGKIRMDCSSPYAMASLIDQRDRFQIATGNDADADRHGIVTPDAGLMNPNHYLAAAIAYLYAHREQWPDTTGIGKTLVSSSMIDRVAADLGRRLVEVPVGFKWFVDGLVDGSLGFGGEESAGASFLRRDGSRTRRLTLGVQEGTEYPVTRYRLTKGGVFVLLTDGVVEGPSMSAEEGLEEVVRLAGSAAVAGMQAGSLAAAVIQGAERVGHEDDAAVLVVGHDGIPGEYGRRVQP